MMLYCHMVAVAVNGLNACFNPTFYCCIVAKFHQIRNIITSCSGLIEH